MSRRREPSWPASRRWGLVLLLVLLARSRAEAFVACDAQGIIAQEPGCPADPAQPCNIRSTVTTPADADCVFDFGARDVAVGGAQAGKIVFGSGSIEIAAANLTVHTNGLLDGAGASGQPGGGVLLRVSNDVTVLGQGTQLGRIDVRGAGAGRVEIEAGGTVTMAGRIDASRPSNVQGASGGEVNIQAGEDIIVDGLIAAIGGMQASGGRIELSAGNGQILASARLNATGGYGGDVRVTAARISLGEIEAVGLNPQEGGGEVSIDGEEVTLAGAIDVSGAGGQALRVYGERSIVIDAPVTADCIGACQGGDIDLSSNGSLITGAAARLSASAGGTEGYGGILVVYAGGDILLNGPVDVSGRAAGGVVELAGGRHIGIAAAVDVSGSLYGDVDGYSNGGEVYIHAGESGRGDLTLSARLDVSAGGCLYGSLQTQGGVVDIAGCDVSVTAAAEIVACGGEGGSIHMIVSRQLTVLGEIRADTTEPFGSPGEIWILHPGALPAVIAAGAISPSPFIELAGFCGDEDDEYYDCVSACRECVELPPLPSPGPVIEACSAAEIMAQEPGCPNDPMLPCNILSTVIAPPAESCSFDFGERDVAVGSLAGGGGRLSLPASAGVWIRAGSFTVHANGIVDSRPETWSSGYLPSVTIETDRAFSVLRDDQASGLIEFSHRLGAGNIEIDSLGDIRVDGRIEKRQICSRGDLDFEATEVTLYSGGDISVDGAFLMSSGERSRDHGGLTMRADGRIDIGGRVELHGGRDSPYLDAEAREIHVSGIIDGQSPYPRGRSGFVYFDADDIAVEGQIDVRALGPKQSKGGQVSLGAAYSLRLDGSLLADVGGDDAYLDIALFASEDLTLGPGSTLSARTLGAAGAAHRSSTGVTLTARRDLFVGGTIDASGRTDPRSVRLEAVRHMFIDAPVAARSTRGTIEVSAGYRGFGRLEVRADLETAPVCEAGEGDCGEDEISLEACDVTVAAEAGVRGSLVRLTARHQAVVDGAIDAGVAGAVELVHADALPPAIGGSIQPAPLLTAKPLCTGPGAAAACLRPCPQCPGGVSEHPWICDDGEICTTDLCSPETGCLHEAVEGCVEPTATVTSTPPPTSTQAPTLTRTPTVTRTATVTRTSTPVPCWGDCDGDGAITRGDLETIFGIVNRCDGVTGGCDANAGGHCAPADVDANGQITASELSRVLVRAGTPCAP